MAEKERLVARLGLSTGVPYMVEGELGYDQDVRMPRMGDGSTTPAKYPTDKSVGIVAYMEQLIVKFAKVEIHEGYTVDGVDLSELNKNSGFVSRGNLGVFEQRALEGDEYIGIHNADGKEGNPRIHATEALLTAIGNAKAANRFTWGEDMPLVPLPGDMHYLTSDQVVYMRVAASEPVEEHWWLDMTSLGGGSGGMKFYSSPLPPPSASLGSEWHDTDEDRIYKRLANNGHHIWMEILF